jgi:hypothetical protein
MFQRQIDDIPGILVIDRLAEVGDFFTEHLNRLDESLASMSATPIPTILSLLEQLFPSFLYLPAEAFNFSAFNMIPNDTERANR